MQYLWDKTTCIFSSTWCLCKWDWQSCFIAQKIPYAKPEQILVLDADIDTQIGDEIFKSGGGDGGHNGLKDLSNVIGKDFKRLKIGVSHPGRKNEVTNWVLGKFKPSEMQLLEELYKKVMVHKDKMFNLEIENLQNLVN